MFLLEAMAHGDAVVATPVGEAAVAGLFEREWSALLADPLTAGRRPVP